MKLSSWFRRSSWGSIPKSNKPDEPQQSQSIEKQREEEELLGVTDELLDYIKSFTLDTFKSFPLHEDDGGSYDVEAAAASSGNVRHDLSDWQERHALLVLSKSKELAHLRFRLCPGWMKEQRFWRMYFMLVKSYVTEYELRAIRLAKLRSMAVESEKTSDTSAYEVEMAERNEIATISPPTP